jgi:hypothetical protein
LLIAASHVTTLLSLLLVPFPRWGLASDPSKAPVLAIPAPLLAQSVGEIWYKGGGKPRTLRWSSSAMRPDARLDAAVFQLTPTRTR